MAAPWRAAPRRGSAAIRVSYSDEVESSAERSEARAGWRESRPACRVASPLVMAASRARLTLRLQSQRRPPTRRLRARLNPSTRYPRRHVVFRHIGHHPPTLHRLDRRRDHGLLDGRPSAARAVDIAPDAPNITSSSSSGMPTFVQTMSASAAASRGEFAQVAPAASSGSHRARVRECTTTG